MACFTRVCRAHCDPQLSPRPLPDWAWALLVFTWRIRSRPPAHEACARACGSCRGPRAVVRIGSGPPARWSSPLRRDPRLCRASHRSQFRAAKVDCSCPGLPNEDSERALEDFAHAPNLDGRSRSRGRLQAARLGRHRGQAHGERVRHGRQVRLAGHQHRALARRSAHRRARPGRQRRATAPRRATSARRRHARHVHDLRRCGPGLERRAATHVG